jgi:DNA-binding NarL/FixJ family response regulator
MPPYNIALVDDHRMFTESLAALINNLDDYKVTLIAENGLKLQDQLKQAKQAGELPNIVLLDVSMPGMNGYATAKWLRQEYPEIYVLALSTHQAENVIVKMLRMGCRGYIMKETRPSELRTALNAVIQNGFYFSDYVTGRMVHSLLHEEEAVKLTNRELEFLKLTPTEMTYKEIADAMGISIKTAEGYRESLFQKLNVKSRVGLALYAVKHELVQL